MKKLSPKNWLALGSLAAALLLAVLLVPAAAQHEQGGPPPMQQIEMMSRMIGLVHELSKIAESPSASGVFAVFSLDDRIKEPADQAKFLERVLPEVKDPAVQRAIRSKLADDYKKAGQNDKSLAEIERLITGKVGG